MKRIEFTQPKPRIEDWRVKLDGRTIGLVWRAGSDYIVSVKTECRAATQEAAFKVARKQARSIAAA